MLENIGLFDRMTILTGITIILIIWIIVLSILYLWMLVGVNVLPRFKRLEKHIAKIILRAKLKFKKKFMNLTYLNDSDDYDDYSNVAADTTNDERTLDDPLTRNTYYLNSEMDSDGYFE